MTDNNVLPIVSIIVVAAALIGLAYANVTGIIQISGTDLVDSNVAFVIVAILFVLMLPWAYKQAKKSDSS
jgi:hypothetical protein